MEEREPVQTESMLRRIWRKPGPGSDNKNRIFRGNQDNEVCFKRKRTASDGQIEACFIQSRKEKLTGDFQVRMNTTSRDSQDDFGGKFSTKREIHGGFDDEDDYYKNISGLHE